MSQDVGKSILESYSRVLETLAFNITARIDDLLSIDKLTPLTVTTPALQATELPYSVSLSSTPKGVPPTTPFLSPTLLLSPSKSEITPFLNKLQRHGTSRAKRVLASYLWPKNP